MPVYVRKTLLYICLIVHSLSADYYRDAQDVGLELDDASRTFDRRKFNVAGSLETSLQFSSRFRVGSKPVFLELYLKKPMILVVRRLSHFGRRRLWWTRTSVAASAVLNKIIPIHRLVDMSYTSSKVNGWGELWRVGSYQWGCGKLQSISWMIRVLPVFIYRRGDLGKISLKIKNPVPISKFYFRAINIFQMHSRKTTKNQESMNDHPHKIPRKMNIFWTYHSLSQIILFSCDPKISKCFTCLTQKPLIKLEILEICSSWWF